MTRVLAVAALLMLSLAGCATSKTATYLDPKTGKVYYCYRQLALGVIPTVVSNNSYADCKTAFEEVGMKRYHGDSSPAPVSHTIPPRSPDPAAIDPERRLACWSRATTAERSRWEDEYQHCLAEPRAATP